ncbi:TolC family protein [Psychroflexus salis]|uniref:Transporter n=1 Tax=Psychroflexus salis TaxID=1526574 RepID=A0A917EA49_9FLAO|nr:TolC family protein [Psychroflexus salis]GGE18341.1 transporter [Psychroflexus salis]
MKKYFLFILFFSLSSSALKAQSETNTGLDLSLQEFLAYVKLYHPIAKQAELKISQAEAKLMKARGNFDPKLYSSFTEKDFKETDYYQMFNAGLSIPVWFGLDIKAGYEQAEGSFLNPERTVPEDGLYKAGISLPLGQGLFINERMATLKKAKIIQNLNQAERDLKVNEVLYKASLTYIDWYQAQKQVDIFEEFLENAEIRFQGIKQSALQGDIPTIDTLEAKITVQKRELSLEKSKLKLIQSRFKLSNFLWLENNVPLQLDEGVLPAELNELSMDNILGTNLLQLENYNVEQHPLLQFLSYGIASLEVDRKLAAERLKPVLDVEYNFLSEQPNQVDTFTPNNFQAGVSFSIPLFLRKERGDLKLTKLKIQDAELEYEFQNLELRNQIDAAQESISSFDRQLVTIEQIAVNFDKLLQAEERKFSFGESSVFLINSREQKLIDARLEQIKANARLFESKALLFNLLANEILVD